MDFYVDLILTKLNSDMFYLSKGDKTKGKSPSFLQKTFGPFLLFIPILFKISFFICKPSKKKTPLKKWCYTYTMVMLVETEVDEQV